MADARMASARLIAVSRSASAAATSASRLMRATSGRPILLMYSFLSRTSLMVNDTTSSPILFMSSAQVRRLGQKLFGGGADRLWVRLHFDLRHCFHGYRHALHGVKILLGCDVEGHQ